MPLASVVEAEQARGRARNAGVLGVIVLAALALTWLAAAHTYGTDEAACTVLMLVSVVQLILGIRTTKLGADAVNRDAGGGAVVLLGVVMLIAAVLSFGFALFLYTIAGISISISLPTGC